MVREGEQQLTVDVPDDLIFLFRREASAKFRYKRGYIKKAVQEAMIDWLRKEGVEYIENGVKK